MPRLQVDLNLIFELTRDDFMSLNVVLVQTYQSNLPKAGVVSNPPFYFLGALTLHKY